MDTHRQENYRAVVYCKSFEACFATKVDSRVCIYIVLATRDISVSAGEFHSFWPHVTSLCPQGNSMLRREEKERPIDPLGRIGRFRYW